MIVAGDAPDAADDEARVVFARALDAIAALQVDLAAVGGAPPPEPSWAQAEFPGLDAAFAYALVRTRRPRRIVCTGGVQSVRFLARAIADGRLEADLRTLDPARIEIGSLEAGDMLFVHSAAARVPLAGLAAGVLVHLPVPAEPGGGFATIWDSRRILRHMAGDLLARDLDTIPMPPGAVPSSRWFEKDADYL